MSDCLDQTEVDCAKILIFTSAGGAILSDACDRFMALEGLHKIQINEIADNMALSSWILLICRSSIPPAFRKEALLYAHIDFLREVLKKASLMI